MAITYNAGTNVITVTGYTEGTPCNLTDIYNADVAGSWGVVTRQCTNQFCFDCALKIGDGSTTTWFADEAKHITFIGAPIEKTGEGVEDRWTFLLKANSNVRLGKLEDAGDKTTSKGCSIIFNNTNHTCFGTVLSSPPSTAHLNIYSTQIQSISAYVCFVYGLDGMKIYDSSFVRYTFPALSKNVTFNNFLINNGYNGINGTSGTMNNIDIINSDKAIAVGSGAVADVVIKNAMFKNNNYVVYMSSAAKDAYLINVDADSWLFLFVSSPTKTCYRQYEFDLALVDSGGTGIDTGKVKIWDKDDSLITNTTTNASGVLATQTLNYGYYTQAGGNTPTMKTPHEIRTYKYGKSMLSSKSTIEAKTGWALTMLTDPHITQTTEATVAAYTGITINHTTETITISENHTLDEIYDYCQYDIITATKQLDQTIHTADGVNFVSEYSFVVNTGITVTATDQKLSMVSGETYTLTGTAQFTGIIATTTTTRIPVKLTNIIDVSRYWVGKESDGSTIFEGTQSGSGDVIGYYEHTADTNIDIRVRKSSASVKYLPWVGSGTLIAAAFSLRIRQIQDVIVT